MRAMVFYLPEFDEIAVYLGSYVDLVEPASMNRNHFGGPVDVPGDCRTAEGPTDWVFVGWL